MINIAEIARAELNGKRRQKRTDRRRLHNLDAAPLRMIHTMLSVKH